MWKNEVTIQGRLWGRTVPGTGSGPCKGAKFNFTRDLTYHKFLLLGSH